MAAAALAVAVEVMEEGPRGRQSWMALRCKAHHRHPVLLLQTLLLMLKATLLLLLLLLLLHLWEQQRR